MMTCIHKGLANDVVKKTKMKISCWPTDHWLIVMVRRQRPATKDVGNGTWSRRFIGELKETQF